MRRSRPLLCAFLVCVSGCTSTAEVEPSGPIARFGSTPIIDGVFDIGEWDDAEIVSAGTTELFRMKHDGVNLYLAINANGGDLVFNTDGGIRVLHWSAQLGSAEYVKADTLTQTLDRPFVYEFWGLLHEEPQVIREALAAYLDEHGWTANTASIGNLMESEFAISFEWLGVDAESARYIEIPSLRMGGGLLISREDPRAEEILAMPREELSRLYPPMSWPGGSARSDSIGMGPLPDTIRIDPADYGRIWIDLRR